MKASQSPTKSRAAPTLALAAALLLLGGCASTGGMRDAEAEPISWQQSLAEGDAAMQRGRVDKALLAYVEALANYPDNAEILVRIGAAHSRIDSLEPAEKAYRRALELSPSNLDAAEGLGLVLLRRNRSEEARARLMRVAGAAPDRWRAQNALGVIADLGGAHADARGYYRLALMHTTQPAKVHNNIGYSWLQAGDLASAESEFENALELNHGYERAWSNLGLVACRQGHYQRGLEAFLEINDEPEAYNNVGYLAMIRGDLDVAERFLRQAVARSPSYYAKAHENLDKVERARAKQRRRGATLAAG